MTGSTVRVGIYWERAVWDRARSAYVADLSDPDAPDSFVGWLTRALVEHARRTPQERAELAEQLTIEPVMGKNVSKSHPLNEDVVAAYEAAIVADREQLGRVVSRSGFAKEAVLAAAAGARRRYGRELPPPPATLPARPVRNAASPR